MVNITGQMEGYMKALGRRINCMEWDITSGQMVAATTDSMSKIKSKALALISGLMGESMRAIGTMENSMARVSSPILREKLNKVFGRMVLEVNGLLKINLLKCKILQVCL